MSESFADLFEQSLQDVDMTPGAIVIGTVIDIDSKGGFGICHEHTTVAEATHAVKRACGLYQDQTRFKKIRKQIMQIDHSWDSAATNYIELYQSLTHQN